MIKARITYLQGVSACDVVLLKQLQQYLVHKMGEETVPICKIWRMQGNSFEDSSEDSLRLIASRLTVFNRFCCNDNGCLFDDYR